MSNGVGTVTSGVPVSTGNLATNTTFILTVTNAAGVAAAFTVTVNVVPEPAITDFTAAKGYITPGSGTSLSYSFTGGPGSIDQGIGSVISGGTTLVAPAATTTYTLTVTATAGGTISRSVTLTVGPALPAPRIISFTAPESVGPGETASLMAVFENGVGTVDQDIGPAIGTITSGVAVNLGVVPVTTQYVLTVKNPAGDNVSAATTIFVSRFRLTGSLVTPRYRHAATLLQDGRVLIVGGLGGISGGPDDLLASAELYDPASGTFTPTGSMSVARGVVTATLLQDGRVLIAGGRTPDGRQTACELYDPVSGTFTPTGSMLVDRGLRDYHGSSFTATRLANGKVLIVGYIPKEFQSPPHDPVPEEVYDPATGTFSYTGSRNSVWTALAGHTATLLQSGKVLIAGGYNDYEGITATSEAHIYDPGSGTFKLISPMIGGRYDNRATLLNDGRVLITGAPWHFGTTAELFDPGTESFGVTGGVNGMQSLCCADTATRLLDGKVLVTQRGAELYDPATGSFSVVGPLRAPNRSAYTATLLLNGKILLVGGYNGSLSNGFVPFAELYQQP